MQIRDLHCLLGLVFQLFLCQAPVEFYGCPPSVKRCDGPSLQSTVGVIYESYEVMTKTWVHGDEVSNGWVHWDGGAHEVEDVLLLGDGVLDALHLGHSMIMILGTCNKEGRSCLLLIINSYHG